MSSQLQVTGEAKIRDIQGPVVANNGVVTALDGDASQYVRGDGTLADFPTSTGGGSSVSYYLNSSVSQGTIGGVAYRQLSKTPISGAGTDITASTNGYIASYITDANDPALLEVPAGNFNCEFYFSVNSNAHNPYVYAELYKYDGTTFTLLGSNVAIPEYLTNGTTLSAYYFAIPVAVAALTITDRLAIRIYVNVDGRVVTLHTENNHLCQVVTTFSKGLTSLNNLTRQVQFLGTGTSGTDFNISSSVATHTFNLPVASATNTGKLSSTDWSTFNGKQAAITLTTTGTSGVATLVDATLNIPNYTTDLSGYLPLTGGTLTGALIGTTASFSSSITSNLSLTVNRFSNGDYLALKIENRPITAGNNGVGIIAFYSNKADATTDTFTSGKIYGKFDSNSYNAARITLSTVTGDAIYQDVLTAKDTNVGIGTINPAQTLDLFTTSTTANGVGTAIQIQSAGTGANQGWVGVNKGTGNGLTFSVQNNSIIFNTDASTKFGGTEKFRISTDRSTFTHPLSILTNDNNFEFNVLLRNNNTGTQALTGFGLSDSSNVRKGQVLWIPSNYVTTSLRNSFLVSSVTNVPLILCADATGADTPNIIFQSGATNKMLLNGTTGNLSIGNTNDTFKLDVSGTGRFTGALTGTSATFSGPVAFGAGTFVSNTARLYTDGLYGAIFTGRTGSACDLLLTDRSGNLAFQIVNNGSTPNVIMNGGGNVLIGTTTDSGYKLDVNGTGRFSGNIQLDATSPLFIANASGASYFGGLSVRQSGTEKARFAANTTHGAYVYSPTFNGFAVLSDTINPLVIASTGAATFSNGVSAYGLVSTDGTYQTQIGVMGTDGYIQALKNSDASATNLRFFTGITEKMRITSAGNVGIGTSSPAGYALNIANSAPTGIFLNSTGTGGSWMAYATSGTIYGYISTAYHVFSGGSTSDFGIRAETNLVFGTGATERLRITSGGDLCVGKSTSNWVLSGLQTEGNGTSIGVTNASASINNLFLRKNDIAGTVASFYYNNTSVGSISITSSVTSYNVTSDYRLKEDLQEIKGLEKLSAIKVYDFKWKDNDARMDGVIAHELQEVLPYAVTGEKDGEMMQSVDYSKIVPILVKSIQELKAEIDELKALINK